MGIFSIFSFLSSFNFSKFINPKSISIIILICVLGYGYFRISGLKKDVIILNQKIEKIKSARDDCVDANKNNLFELSKLQKKYKQNEEAYSKRIKSRDVIIYGLRKDLKLMKKKLEQKPSKIIKIKDCKIPIIEGKDIKDEYYKDLYNSISNIGK